MTKILDLDTKENAKKKIVQLKKEITKLQAIVDKKESLFDKINNIDDVFNELGIKRLRYFEHYPEKIKDKIETLYHISMIELLFNGNWVKDFNNSNQQKWYPYFTTSPDELVFAASGSHSYSSHGAVAYFKDQETATFVGKKFIDIYRKLL